MSTVITAEPLTKKTAESSPGPTDTDGGIPRCRVMRLIRPNSPASDRVRGSDGVGVMGTRYRTTVLGLRIACSIKSAINPW